MFDQDIFYDLDSNTNLSLAQNKMSSQQQKQLFQCLQTFTASHRILNPEIDAIQQVPNQLQFEEIDFFSSSLKIDGAEDFPADDQEANILSHDKNQQSKNQQKSHKKNSCTNNIANYIIKHSLKKMLNKKLKDQITPYCINQGVTYAQFFQYWEAKLDNIMKKHIGVNMFRKLIKPQSPFVEVCKCFMTVYLKLGYPLYVMASSIGDKMAYFQCAVKLLYMSKVSKQKSYKLFNQAQNGLVQ